MLLPASHAPRRGFTLTVLDVGEGLSSVVRTAHHTLLFDTGPRYPGGLDMGRAAVLPYLRQAGVDRLDMMIISHKDMDHRGGAPAVRAALPIAREIGAESEVPCREGQHWLWDGVDFRVLNPPATAEGSRNNRSCVLRVAYAGHAALLPADIEAPAERRLLHDDRRLLQADVLVAPHHGSNSSSTAAFIAAVAPGLVVFPAGWENRFHFPRPAVVVRYRTAHVRMLDTGEDGAISVHLGPAGPGSPSAYRCRQPRLWRVRPAAGCRGGQSWVGFGASP